ncbi:MAG: hypothetical protein JWR83_3603 [Aeromicrobium sp.]|nr:hypothetical protein [Aeromicrobium sp.]
MPSTAELRSAIRSLTVLAASDLSVVWNRVQTPDQARDMLETVLPDVALTYRMAAATVAADWYDERRDAKRISGRFRALVPHLDDAGAEVLARWGVGSRYSDDPDWSAAKTLIEGGLQRRIADAARDTIRSSSIEDPQAHGWERETSGGCEFCEMLASRGVVYSQASADFASHDHCQCIAVPAFDGEARPVQPYTPSDRDISDDDRARVRAYLAQHHAG